MKNQSNRINQNKNSLLYQLKTFVFAFRGISVFYSDGPKAKTHLIFTLLAGLFGIFLKIKLVEWIILCLCVGFVFTAEIFNTALEKLADFKEPEFNKTIGVIKDLSAAAVLIAALTTAIVGLLIFVPKIIEFTF